MHRVHAYAVHSEAESKCAEADAVMKTCCARVLEWSDLSAKSGQHVSRIIGFSVCQQHNLYVGSDDVACRLMKREVDGIDQVGATPSPKLRNHLLRLLFTCISCKLFRMQCLDLRLHVPAAVIAVISI